ncbi:VOC family protein [Pseudokineococcus sp. 1T1Z-3]|uniref:VOC family protein n=1 Tax=Pseudokineococcus sp. 1T1Z-3 TaxID=3132745 RepID=UPI0030B4FD05
MSSDETSLPSTAARPVVSMYSFFTSDPARLARFWGERMQLPVALGATDDLVMLDLNHAVARATWIFERVEDATAGTAPVGLELGVATGADGATSWTDVADRAELLGATRVAQREVEGVLWIEMRGPDGNRFRVFGPRPQ